MAGPRIDVVHVGSASRDLTPDDPRGWRLGGGATYAALTTARLGLRTAALIGVDDEAATADELDLLRDAGVEVRLAVLAEGPVFDNREGPGGRVQVSHAVGRPIGIPAIPADWRAATAWSIVPVAGEIGDAWAGVVPPGAFLSLGWQGFLRVLAPGGRVERLAPVASALLGRADLVGVSRHDLAPGTASATLVRLLHPGADLVVTEGDAGGVWIRVGEDGSATERRFGAAATVGEVDATGAGDVFLGALLATVVRPGIAAGAEPAQPARSASSGPGLDLEFAAAAGALTVEGPGLAGVPDLRAILARMRDGPSPRGPRDSRSGPDSRRRP